MDKQFNFDELHAIIATLRSENGCPWDRAQTHETLKASTIEEAYEVNQAINDLTASNDPSHLKEELGDLLLQIMLHSQIAEEYGEFTLEDVIDGVARKMIHRHPHVFGGRSYENEEERRQDWDRLKGEEAGHQYESPASELAEVPVAFPALIRGQKVMKKALRHNLVAASDEDIMTDMMRTMVELQYSLSDTKDLSDADRDKEMSLRLGRSLFSILRFAAKHKIDAEASLTEEIESFIRQQQRNE